MYITLFDLLTPLNNIARWKSISAANRALITGLLIVLVLLLVGGIAISTSYHVVPLVILGVFCGCIVAKAFGRFLAPKIQSHVTAFLGGITTGNIGSKGAGLRQLIDGVAKGIDNLVATFHAKADLTVPLTWSIWIALLTALVILAANAYYANQDTSQVGDPLTPTPPVVPVPAPAPARP